MDRVAFSTFTLHNDDILFMTRAPQGFLVFSHLGKPLKIKLCKDTENILSTKKLDLVQVKHMEYLVLGFVMKDKDNYYIFELQQNKS